MVQLEHSQFVLELSAEDKARLVRNKAGPDDYAELDYELVVPAKKKAGVGGSRVGAVSKISSVAETRSVRDTLPTFNEKMANTAKTT